MAINPNETPTTLTGRVAAEKAAGLKQAKQKTAAAWTLAKTMLPGVPPAEQLKFANNLMVNSVTTLKVALRQTAVNAHWTRIAEQFSDVHKVDLNDLLEDPSILTKETKGVEQELKGDAKSASKIADDRKDAGPLPAEYPEPKRDEPTELDGGKAGQGRPDSWTEGPGKEASKKTACEEGCKGDCDHKKEAAKKAAAKKIAEEGEGAAPEDKTGDAGVDDAIAAAADGAAEGAAEGDAGEGDEGGAGDAGEGDGDEGDAGDAGEGDASGEETFDPEKQNLEEIASDIEADNQRLQDAIAELSAEPGDLSLGDEGEGDQGDFDALLGDEGDVHADDADHAAGGEDEVFTGDGEELNFDDIFNEGAMSDKVSALNDEDEDTTVEIQFNDGDDFFAPSDPADLESVLEQEEGISSPADMFAVTEAEDDPMARLFASSSKQASDEEIIAPGSLDDFFETDLKGDDRDSDSDHDGSIMEDVFRALKQPTRDDHRDTEPNLKSPAGKEAGKGGKKPVASQGIRRLKQASGKSSRPGSGVNLASLLFTDESDFQ